MDRGRFSQSLFFKIVYLTKSEGKSQSAIAKEKEIDYNITRQKSMEAVCLFPETYTNNLEVISHA